MSDNAHFSAHDSTNAAGMPAAILVEKCGEAIGVKQQKIIIIGLPRTGTTSVSVALLEQGLNVAHMAFTKAAFMLADAISDVPCFSDYRQLDTLFPHAKFVYLERDVSAWVPSMQMLLSRMLPHLDDRTGRFHPIMKRCFRQTFGVGTVSNPQDAAHLMACYQQHQQQVLSYFGERRDFLRLNIGEEGSLNQLLGFLGLAADAAPDFPDGTPAGKDAMPVSAMAFPQLNVGRNVASWDEYKHPNKVSSNAAGPENRKYFDYRC